MSASMQNRNILVTGGGTGIGAACARELVALGANVTISGRTEATLSAVVEKIDSEDLSGSIKYVVGDVTNEENVQTMMATAAGDQGVLHGCVANAGGGGMPMLYANVDTDEFTRVLNLNVLGTMFCVKHAIPYLQKAGGGSFVGMSSLASGLAHRYFHAYCVAKSGIDSMMRNAANEYGRDNIRFNAIRPGFISTEIMEGVPRDSVPYKTYVENTPMNGVGDPEDVAYLARFLLSDDARWITGQIINIDGGNCLRGGPDFSSFAGD